MDTGTDIYLVQTVSNGHKNSKLCRPASCEDTAAAATPDVRKVVRARSSLFAALIKSEIPLESKTYILDVYRKNEKIEKR